jgi:hypothetical protein
MRVNRQSVIRACWMIGGWFVGILVGTRFTEFQSRIIMYLATAVLATGFIVPPDRSRRVAMGFALDLSLFTLAMSYAASRSLVVSIATFAAYWVLVGSYGTRLRRRLKEEPNRRFGKLLLDFWANIAVVGLLNFGAIVAMWSWPSLNAQLAVVVSAAATLPYALWNIFLSRHK